LTEAKSELQHLRMEVDYMKAQKNKEKVDRLMKKINDKKLQTLYLQFLHKGLKKFAIMQQYKKLNYYKELPLSLRFYCDPPTKAEQSRDELREQLERRITKMMKRQNLSKNQAL